MYLDFIEITNFRPFYGTQKIDFGYTNDENLTIILANNGSGKTSLVNAFTWCLYGKELHDVRDKSEPLYNLRAAAEVEENSGSGAEIFVKVKVRFYFFEENEDGENIKKYFTISRELPFQKWGTADWQSPIDSYVIVDETDQELLEDDAATFEIEDKIPKDMFQYFFFNGATLANYFEDDSDLSLKTSIEEISQIDLINDVSSHLSGTYTTINNRFREKTPKGHKDYNKLIEEKIKEKNDKQEQISKNHNNIDIAINNIAKYEDLLDKVDSDYAKELNVTRNSLESDLKTVKNTIKEDSKEYESLILELFPITVLFDELVKSLEIADEARTKKTAPPQIERDLLNDILEDGKCICGIKLEDHPECVEELKRRLKGTSGVKVETFYKDYYDIKDVLKRLKDLPKIESLRESIDSAKKRKITLDTQIENISNELASFDLEEVEIYEKHLQQNKKQRDDLREENISLSSKVSDLENQINQLKGERDRAEDLEGELKILSDKIKFCEEAMGTITDLRNNVQKHIRGKVNDKIREQFIGIDWQYEKYTDVTIEDDYQIQITKKSGRKVSPGDLSDGEESLLALSFMMALHSLSGFEIPLIIDAPLEKLDKGKRIDFIKDLHNFTKDKQIVFLFTDSQYTDDVRANMLKNIIGEYELKPSEDKTEIVKHG